jgi:hypothetical protein
MVQHRIRRVRRNLVFVAECTAERLSQAPESWSKLRVRNVPQSSLNLFLGLIAREAAALSELNSGDSARRPFSRARVFRHHFELFRPKQEEAGLH